VRVNDPTRLGTPLGALLATDALVVEMLLDDERKAAHEYLERTGHVLRVRHPTLTVEYRQGRAADELLAATEPGDLLVLTTHGRGGTARWFLGSVAEAVVRRATVPVFLVRTTETEAPSTAIRRLVVPLDGSTLAEEALPTAAALARRLQVPLHLLTVIDVSEGELLDLVLSSVSPTRLGETLTRLLTDAETRLAHTCDRLGHDGLETSTEVRHGPAAEGIVGATRPGDLIVMTSHGRTGPVRWLLGSVAEAVVRHATVPVLLVRATPPTPGSNASNEWFG
jgi:nucleotide-binding universal stress UspA family protein